MDKRSRSPFKPYSARPHGPLGLCEDLIKQNKGESRYSTRSMVLIKSARVTDRIRTCAISNSDSKSDVLDRSAIGTPRDDIVHRFDNRIKRRRSWLLLGWVTAERSCPCKQLPARPLVVGRKPLVTRLSVRESFLALTSPGKIRNPLLYSYSDNSRLETNGGSSLHSQFY
ncbi:hypothetical protein J6590_045382 [Homalodisca vitripennis]|nr:hypothetical protein J6590_045382 [Homalodisca vitripennis]